MRKRDRVRMHIRTGNSNATSAGLQARGRSALPMCGDHFHPQPAGITFLPFGGNDLQPKAGTKPSIYGQCENIQDIIDGVTIPPSAPPHPTDNPDNVGYVAPQYLLSFRSNYLRSVSSVIHLPPSRGSVGGVETELIPIPPRAATAFGSNENPSA